MKNQSGVALVVALMITVIIGILAISLAGLSYRSQRASNLSYENVVSELNAITGVNRVITFINQVQSDEQKDSYLSPRESTNPSSLRTPVNTSWKINGKTSTVDLKNIMFNGVDLRMDEYGSSYLDYANGQFWYRTPEGWDVTEKVGDCANCLNLNNGTTITRIERRDFAGASPEGSDVVIGYRFYRITSRGSDTGGAQTGTMSQGASQSIVQTNFGILDVK